MSVAKELRAATEEQRLTILGDAIEWSETAWPEFLERLQGEAAKGLSKSRHIILPPNAPPEVTQAVMTATVEALQTLPTPVPKIRARYVALMAKAEAEGLKVERLAPCAWEVSW